MLPWPLRSLNRPRKDSHPCLSAIVDIQEKKDPFPPGQRKEEYLGVLLLFDFIQCDNQVAK
jgi:hypothetical protein